MKKWLLFVLTMVLLLNCSSCRSTAVPVSEIEAPLPDQLAPAQSIDWSQLNLSAIGEDGNWVLTPGMGPMVNAVFSADGQTIYALGSDNVRYLRKSSDGGRNWITLPAFSELGLHEAFFMKMVNDELFIGSGGGSGGIFRSVDGGETFNQMPPITAYPGVWGFDATVDASGRPILLANLFGGKGNGLWMLSYPYEHWVDMRVGNVDSGGSGYCVWRMAFSPNYAQDRQIMALISDEEHLRVSFKYGDEAWGERIADSHIPDNETYCDLRMAFSYFAFPDDYDSLNPVVFIGAGLYTEFLCQTPQYADLYRIDGRSADLGFSITTDLDVGGKSTSTPVNSVIIKGSADAAIILAGSAFQVYRSTDGGQSWQAAKKPPTGGTVQWMAFDPSDDKSYLVYALSTEVGSCFVPRGSDVPVGESAFSYSTDGGVTWNQVSQIDTRIDEIIGHAVSPDYEDDETMFVLTSSRHMLNVSITEDEIINVTRDLDEPGVTTKILVTPHQANPPLERMMITNGDPSITRVEWDPGTGPYLVLNDEYPKATIRVIPLKEKRIHELIDMFSGFLPGYTDPWYILEWLDLTQQPRQVVMYVTEGSVTVTKSEVVVDRISVDGDASDWQGIEPLITDPERDALSQDEDLKAFYMTNDYEYLYFMLEFYGQNPRSLCEIMVDLDLDGVEDHNIFIYSRVDPDDPTIDIKPCPDSPSPSVADADLAAFTQVVEARFPLNTLGIDALRISSINIKTGWSSEDLVLDWWEGSLEVDLDKVTAPAGNEIPFPSIESLWKTTDGGTTWERILTSGLNLSIGGVQVIVGSLDSVALSINFAQNKNIYVYEGGDSSRVWVSTDGGTTFALCK